MNSLFTVLFILTTLLLAPTGRTTLASTALDDCPKLSIACPDEVPREGRIYIVKLRVEGVDPARKLTYKWSVSKGGEIVEGQGTPTLKVRCTHPEESLTTSVDVGGLDEHCTSSASCSFWVS